MKKLVVVRGAGELGSAVAHIVHRAGFRVLMLEQRQPTATRRRVSFSDAMYAGEATVERLTCYRAANLDEARKRLKKDELIMLADPEMKCIKKLKPAVLVDAIGAHQNMGMKKNLAKHTIALGPGFCAGRDAEIVVDIMRGHNLGRLVTDGYTSKEPDFGEAVVGHAMNEECFIAAPEAGAVTMRRGISLMVHEGEVIGHIETLEGRELKLKAGIDGVMRGAIHDGCLVSEGMTVAEIHPTMGQEECFTISDKGRCIGGAVLAAIMILRSKDKHWGPFGD